MIRRRNRRQDLAPEVDLQNFYSSFADRQALVKTHPPRRGSGGVCVYLVTGGWRAACGSGPWMRRFGRTRAAC